MYPNLNFSEYVWYVAVKEIAARQALFQNFSKDTELDEEMQENEGFYEFHVDQEKESMNIHILVRTELRNALSDPKRFWKDGIVPYKISKKYGSGCSATVGMVQKGKVTLSKGCNQRGIVIHEFMHILGFLHEHSRPDRDKYVKINWENIQERSVRNFRKYKEHQVQNGNITYDYNSVMHYGSFSFAKDRSIPSITPLQENITIGQRDGFSQFDLEKIHHLYYCKMKNTTEAAETLPTHSENTTTVTQELPKTDEPTSTENTIIKTSEIISSPVSVTVDSTASTSSSAVASTVETT
ncbi:zinc metalloproteinase nas-13 [Trichonephila inaurata madagascariensis]|uniref:Metalloendopeptidase n=1 Tax=Trichonephila inaurata madagascariensis TaxID=2747483 RepID=A0A8X6JU08_9ARAC|nr:zinc metalloproteinase nas-13 [Trichonephila inaurata madagascariensis]